MTIRKFKISKIIDTFFQLLLYLTIPLLVLGYVFFPAFSFLTSEPLPLKSERAKLVQATLEDYSAKTGLKEMPSLRIAANDPRTPYASRAPLFGSVVVVSPQFMDPHSFSDNDVRGVIAHELGHVIHWDAYKLWNKCNADWHRNMELAADKFGASIAGCLVMHELFRNHWESALAGYNNKDDPHPHPKDRMTATGTCE